jgi:hypothetical protein
MRSRVSTVLARHGLPGKLFGGVRGAGNLIGGLTNSLKGSVSAGAMLAGSLSLKVALVGSIAAGATLGGALTAAAPAPSSTVLNAAPAGSTLYVAEGDSITAGAITNGTSYASLWAGTNASAITFSDQAQSGNNLGNVTGRASTVDGLKSSNPGMANYLLSVMIGTNDYPIGTTTSDFLTRLTTYCDARRSAGWKVVLFTILPRLDGQVNGNQSAFDAWALTVNNGIRGMVAGGHADAVVDVTTNSVVGTHSAPADTTLYPDQLHPSVLCHQYIENQATSTLNAVCSNASAPPGTRALVGAISGAATLTGNLTAAAASVTFDTTSVPANTVLSNGNRDATISGGSGNFNTVRVNTPKSAGKIYVEEVFVSGQASGPGFSIGLCDGAFSKDAYLGSGGNSCMFYGPTGQTFTSGIFASANGVSNSTYVANDRWMLAVDFTAGKVWLGKNGTWLSGDPAAGTAPWLTFTTTGAPVLYMASTLYDGATVTTSTTVRLPATTNYTPPSGYTTLNA